MNINLGQVAALSTAVLWSISSIIFSEVSKKVSSSIINITRLSLATFFLILVVIFFQLPLKLTYTQYFYLAISGILGLIIGDTFLYISYKYYGARLGMLMLTLSTPFSILLAFLFLDEKIGIISLVAISITLLGVAIVILQKNEDTIDRNENQISFGVSAGIVAALAQAGGLIFAKLAFNEASINGFSATFIRFSSALLPMALIFFILPFIKKKKVQVKIFKSEFKLILYGTLIGTFLGITLSFYAVTNTYVGIASALMATVPVIMLPIVMIYYKVQLNIISIIGSAFCVIGVIIILLK